MHYYFPITAFQSHGQLNPDTIMYLKDFSENSCNFESDKWNFLIDFYFYTLLLTWLLSYWHLEAIIDVHICQSIPQHHAICFCVIDSLYMFNWLKLGSAYVMIESKLLQNSFLFRTIIWSKYMYVKIELINACCIRLPENTNKIQTIFECPWIPRCVCVTCVTFPAYFSLVGKVTNPINETEIWNKS